ncbi:MAG: phytoene/squalene synthase family protein [Pseudomonadota bacterium]
MLRSFEQSAGADIDACRSFLKTGSRSFYAASFFLPRRVRAPASALYAFCRLADDAVDIDCRAGAIERLRARLDRVYLGTPESHPIDRAMMHVVEHFEIPKHVPEALIEGLGWDCAGRNYDTLADLQGYAARVAGTVGVMMSLVMGVRAPDLLARAVDLGIAMQLTNIARDVGEDARMGRVYLPKDWLVEAGIDVEVWLTDPQFTPEIGLVVRRLLDAADRLYARAEIGIAGLPKRCRPGILAARLLYAEIGEEVRRNGLDSINQRAVVPAARKLQRLSEVLSTLQPQLTADSISCLEPARFLLVGISDNIPSAATGPNWWNLQARVIWVLDLFEQLEQREAAEATRVVGRATA